MLMWNDIAQRNTEDRKRTYNLMESGAFVFGTKPSTCRLHNYKASPEILRVEFLWGTGMWK